MENLNILYVEDDSMIRMLTTKMLEKRVKKIISVEDGVEALKIFNDFTPDIVITDLEMPNMGGVELIEKIKEKDNNIKTIIISGDSDVDTSLADFLLTKPINKKILLEKLKEFAV